MLVTPATRFRTVPTCGVGARFVFFCFLQGSTFSTDTNTCNLHQAKFYPIFLKMFSFLALKTHTSFSILNQSNIYSSPLLGWSLKHLLLLRPLCQTAQEVCLPGLKLWPWFGFSQLVSVTVFEFVILLQCVHNVTFVTLRHSQQLFVLLVKLDDAAAK